MIKKIGCALLLLAMAGAAAAGEKCEKNQWSTNHWSTACTYDHKLVKAPELDPASAMAGLTLMVGGLAVLRGRRTKSCKA